MGLAGDRSANAITQPLRIDRHGLLHSNTISDTLVSQKILRSDQRAVLLPINTLDQILPLGAATPSPQGTITGMALGTASDLATGLVIVSSANANQLTTGDKVQVAGTGQYDGLYQVSGVSGDSFQITAPFAGPAIGTWQKLATATDPLVYDGMLTAYEQTPDGQLVVHAVNHGLQNGDQVQIIGSSSYDGSYPATM